MYLESLRAGAVEEYGQEADGDVEDLARNFMAMDLWILALMMQGATREHTNDRHF